MYASYLFFTKQCLTFGSAFLFQFHPHLHEASQIFDVPMRNFQNEKHYEQVQQNFFVNIYLFSQEYIPFIIEEKLTEES